MTGRCRAQHRDGERRTGRLAETHAEIEQRIEPESGEQPAVAGLGGEVGGAAVIEGAGTEHRQRCDGGRGDETIEEDRNPGAAGADDGTRDRHQFPAAQPAQQVEGIAARPAMMLNAGGDHPGLAEQRLAGEPGPRSDPVGRVAAEQGTGDRRGGGRVADAHLADAEHVRLRVHRHQAAGEGGREVGFGQGRCGGEIGGRPVEIEGIDREIRADARADLVDGGAAGPEVRDHLSRDRRRIGRNAAHGDTMIAGKHPDHRAVHPRRMAPLPGSEPFGQHLQAAKRAGRLGEPRFPGRRRRRRRPIRPRQAFDQTTDPGHVGDGFQHLSRVPCGFRPGLILRRLTALRPGRDVFYNDARSHDQTKPVTPPPEPSLADPPRPARALLAGWRGLRSAAGFLTVLPVAPAAATGAVPSQAGGFLSGAMAWFPVVGAAIGATAGGALLLADGLGAGAAVAIVAAVAAPVALTGALHEDGLADVADGFGGGWSREDKLRILSDSRIGAFGVVTLILAFAGRFAALADLGDGVAAVMVLIAAATLSRAVIPAVARFTPSARPQGLAGAAGRPSAAQVGIALGSGALIVALLLPAPAALAAVAVAISAAAGIAILATRQIGGHTGDVLGATQVAAEVVVLVVLSALA